MAFYDTSLRSGRGIAERGASYADLQQGMQISRDGDPRTARQLMRGDRELAKVDPSRYSDLAGMYSDAAQRAAGTGALDYRDARAAALSNRMDQYATLAQLRRLAQGDDSVAARVGAQNQAGLARNIASQVASSGRYDPVTQMAALSAISEGRARMGNESAIAQAQERQASQAQYLAALASQRQQELGQGMSDLQAAAAEMQARQSGLQGEANLLGYADAARERLYGYGTQAERDIYGRYAAALAGRMGQPSGPGTWEKVGGILGTGVGAILPFAI